MRLAVFGFIFAALPASACGTPAEEPLDQATLFQTLDTSSRELQLHRVRNDGSVVSLGVVEHVRNFVTPSGGEYVSRALQSPNGVWIAVVGSEEGQLSADAATIRVLRSHDGTPSSLPVLDYTSRTAPWPLHPASPRWSPDGRRLVFINPARTELVAAQPETGTVDVIARGEQLVNFSWAPDGSRLLYWQGATFSPSPPIKFSLHSVNPDGSDDRLISSAAQICRPPASSVHQTVAPLLAASEDSRVTWAPDTSRIAYLERSDPAIVQLVTASPDGSGSRVVWRTDSDVDHGRGVHDYPCSWSPSGGRVAVSDDAGGVYTVKADGSDPQTLPTNVGELPASYTSFVWFPDGSRLALLAATYDVPSSQSTAGLFSVRPDGSNLQTHERPASSTHVTWLGWSQDGSRAAYLTFNDLNLLNFKTGSHQRFPVAAPASPSPAMNPARTHVAYLELSREPHTVNILSLDGQLQTFNMELNGSNVYPRLGWQSNERVILVDSSGPGDWMDNRVNMIVSNGTDQRSIWQTRSPSVGIVSMTFPER